MLKSFWNYASPIKNIVAQNKPTNAAHNNYSFKNEILKGALYIKLKSFFFQKLSDDCLIDINNFTNDYYLKIKYNGNELIIDNDTKLFQFINQCGNKCITWQKKSIFYILELFQEKFSKNKENILQLQLPIINPISIDDSGILSETKSYTESKIINDLYSNTNTDKTSKNNNKNIFIKRFEEFKEIYIVKGTTFKYDKLLEEVIPFKDKEHNDSAQSFLKLNYIGNNTYILVLEQNDVIISFIKIININDISINENSSSISFNYVNDKGDNNPYIFSFDGNSTNEIKFFKNLIMRFIYEINNRNCDFNYIPNFLSFESIDIHSEFSQESNLDKSFFFSTKKKQNDMIMLLEDSNNNFYKTKDSFPYIKKDIYFNKNDNHSINNFCFNNDDIAKNFGTIKIFDDYSGLKIFNKKGENIKTFLTKEKSPIRYIDFSHDNKYILITCDKYVVVITTDNKNKIEPLFLRLDKSFSFPQNKENENFIYAKFITNEYLEEKMIIANLGKHIILWNFEKVIKGDINCYQIINAN